VHISRLVVDHAAVLGNDAAELHERVTSGIAARLAASTADRRERLSPLVGAIADALVLRVVPYVGRNGRNRS
jgi:hypothetical protein